MIAIGVLALIFGIIAMFTGGDRHPFQRAGRWFTGRGTPSRGSGSGYIGTPGRRGLLGGRGGKEKPEKIKKLIKKAVKREIKDLKLDEILKEIIEKFDYFRRLRNDSIYKAVVIVPEDAKDSLIFAELFVVKINSFS